MHETCDFSLNYHKVILDENKIREDIENNIFVDEDIPQIVDDKNDNYE